jgi:hypothetical protein
MADSYGVTVSFGEIPRDLMNDPGKVLRVIAYPAIVEGTEFLAGRLAMNTPVGATAKARQGVVPSVEMGVTTITGHVDYAEPASAYIAFADQGTRPHWPPFAPIAYWVRRVLGIADARVAFLVQRAISRRGTRAQKFVEGTALTNGHEAASIVAASAGRHTAMYVRGSGT